MFRAKIIRSETKVLDAAAGTVHAVMSTEAKDRDGDIIRVAGWDLSDFVKHPALIASHNYFDLRSQIGHWEEVGIKGKRLEGVAHYYIGQGNEQADWGFNLASKGMAAFSVGFVPDMALAKELKDSEGFFPSYEFNGQKLLETSQVTIPSNPEALQRIKHMKVHPVVGELVDEALKNIQPTSTTAEWVQFDIPPVLTRQDIFNIIKELLEAEGLLVKDAPESGIVRLDAASLNRAIRAGIDRALKETT